MNSIRSATRNTNLEILRIISMIFIVMSHSDDWMGLPGLYENVVCPNKFIMDWLHLGGQVGVGCFLLISGYFMVDRKIELNKILRISGEVWFYTISIYCVFLVVNILNQSGSFSSLLREGIWALFPILLSHYWFVTAYIILMVLSPFFNKLISVMDKRMYCCFLLTIITIFVIIDGGLPHVFLEGMSDGRLIPVFIMYFIAGYIKKYGSAREGDKAQKHITVAVFTYLMLFATVVVIDLAGGFLNSPAIVSMCYFWRPLNSPFVVIICIELFLGFLKLPQKKNNKYVNAIAKSTFGIYLLHSNRIVSRYVLPALFPIYKETRFVMLLIYSAGSVAIVLIVCSIIDIIRGNTIEKIWIGFLDKYLISIEQKILQKASKIYIRCKNILYKYYQ